MIEDRKWKSSPTVQIPQARIRNGWAQDRSYQASRDGDVPGAVLLGRRQLDFLEQWAADWSGGIWMKAVVSQTLFANVATLPREDAMSGDIVPRLRVLPPGEYAEGDIRVQDHDSNGWPQTGRNMALKRMRRGFAVHITGDQHLGSTIQYGIDEWGDAGYAICVPAVANVWPRRWFPPPAEGNNRRPGTPLYTGDFLDGFGNKITVQAVSNPHTMEAEPAWITQRAPGYGIIVFNRETRQITMSNWPRWVDPAAAGAQPYPGWPITIDQMDNYDRKAVAYLPTLEVTGMQDPVVQISDEDSGKIVYSIRIRGTTFRPRVFRHGRYSIRIGEPGTPRMKLVEHLESAPSTDDSRLVFAF